MTAAGRDAGGGLRTRARGLSGECPADPCLMVILGASGDLAARELLPSLYELAARELLPDPFAVVGFARSRWSDGDFRERMKESVARECAFDPGRWRELERRLFYVPGDFTDPPGGDWARLCGRVGEIREEVPVGDRIFFHLATPPRFFGTIAGRLAGCGLATAEEPGGWRRLVVEKPFGQDRRSAAELDEELRSAFPETSIYRIDHFLGKETVQNMLVFRFGNPSFEPIWNRNYVDNVQITAAEGVGVGGRGAFYDETGVLRDMVQNHLLQLLCVTAIEPPVAYEGDALRDETVKVLRSIRPPDPAADCVLGQYGPGRVDGREVPGYTEEEDVPAGSSTATFAALELGLDSWRWAGVPFYLRTGKRMDRKATEVAIVFRPTPHVMFPGQPAGGSGAADRRGVLVFRLQPEEGIAHTFMAKQPGPGLRLEPVTMDFNYADTFGIRGMPRAYAWLLLDVMQGKQTLFARSDWIREAWSVVDPLVEHGAGRPQSYAAGSRGPDGAAELVRRSGRGWRSP